MLKEFKAFIMRGNVMDMAVGIIMGAAFTSIVKSLVDDVIMPPIGLLLGNIDFSNFFIVLKDGKVAGPYATLAAAKSAGAVTVSYGLFVNTIISFLIVGFTVFLMIKQVNKFKSEPPPEVPDTKECPFCMMAISAKASRCPHCTSALDEPKR